jgi:flagellar biosynthesis/type III secretory pathway M-ring protein FliF/YscJ
MQVNQLFAHVRALPPAFRLGAPIAIALLALVPIGFAVVTHQVRIALFASSLRAEQLSEVEERLAEWGVPYVESNGNVLVDGSRRNDLLLRLSLAGVPHAHVATTSEALATVGVLTPEAVIDAQTRAGLAGDIEVGLRSVNGVDDARVIIAPAKVAQFADESAHDASASVRVRLHPGAQLGASAIAGIRAFVAASVAGLNPSRVTILDDRGVALGSAAVDDSGELQRSLQSALDATLGAGMAVVRVRVEYDRATTERRDTRREPLAGGSIARDDIGEAYGDRGKHYEKHDVRVDRGSDIRELVSRSEAGGVTRVSTAVYVDRSRTVDLASVRALAAATVGFDARRGDELVAQAVDFTHQTAPKNDPWWLAYNAIAQLLPAIVLTLGVIVFVRSVAPGVMRVATTYVERVSISRATHNVAGFAPAQVRGALAHEPPHAAAAVISALPAATAAAVLELYPQHEREAIVRRMQRPHSTLIPDVEELLKRRA